MVTYINKDTREELPAEIAELVGTMPFGDRLEVVGFRHQNTGRVNKETKQPDQALVPIWKDHKICRSYVRSKY